MTTNVINQVELTTLADFFQAELQGDLFPNERRGIIVASNRQVCRLGFALQKFPELRNWAENLDAVWLHRFWDILPKDLPEGVGVLGYHDCYDAQLTVGSNAPLARELAMRNIVDLGRKNNYPIGMVGDIPKQSFEDLCLRFANIFGDLDGIFHGKMNTISRIAVVGAMNVELIDQAVELGAEVYVTGQFRESASPAIAKHGIGVIAIGHPRGEVWGMTVLARLVTIAFPGIETFVHKH